MNPRPKTMDRVYFCFLGNCSDRMTGNGMVKSEMSVTRLMLAMTYQMGRESRHLPSTEGSQNAATGRQIKVSRKQSVTVHALKKATP